MYEYVIEPSPHNGEDKFRVVLKKDDKEKDHILVKGREAAEAQVARWKEQYSNDRGNEKTWPAKYDCSFLEQGLVSYKDMGAGIALLKKETIDNMLESIIGKPVIINHKDVTPADFKKEAVGYVTDAYFNAATGWYHLKFILTDDRAKELVADGYSVSCSFNVNNAGPGGEWHAIPYDEEILGGAFTHLALVTTPRYEECRVRANGKEGRVIKHRQVGETDKRENVLRRCPQCRNDLEINQPASGVHGTVWQCGKHGIICAGDIEYDPMNNTNLDAMSPLMRDKYFGALSDSGLQLLMDDKDVTEEMKTALKLHQDQRLRDKEEALAGAGAGGKGGDGKKTNQGGGIMELFKKIFKRKENATEDPEKLQTSDVLVQVANGKEVSVAELIENYNKANAAEETPEEKAAREKKEKEEAEAAAESKKNAKIKADADAAEATRLAAEKAKDPDHFERLNSLREAGEELKGTSVDMLHDRISRGKNRYGTPKAA